VLPLLQQCFGLLDQFLFPLSMPIRYRYMLPPCAKSYFLLPGLRNTLVGIEQSANVYGLATPDIPSHSPVEGQFERATVERAT
jgi:hypothetical protein